MVERRGKNASNNSKIKAYPVGLGVRNKICFAIKVVLFMNNASSHPESLNVAFSQVKVAILPKNTSSKLQPLDAGVITNFKVF